MTQSAQIWNAVGNDFMMPPHFIMASVDCWQEIFDYLSLSDILEAMRSFVRLRQIGGYYFRENFREVCWW